MSNGMGWIGVDLDGTLAEYHVGQAAFIGAPVPAMVKRVKEWLADGFEVRIVTARVSSRVYPLPITVIERIQDWTKKHIGVRLKVTAEKDFQMIELWDDRAVQVVFNTGIRVGKAGKAL